jgi:multidrug resistance efflux pump
LRKELDAASAKLVVSESDRARTYLDDTIRLYVEQEARRLVVLERQVQVAIDRLEAERTKTHLECLQPLYVRKIVSDLEMTNARIYCEEAAKRLEDTNKVLGEAQAQEKNADQRLAKFPAFQPADVPTELAPIIAAANVQEARIKELEIEISRLTIRAPIRGRICAILHWPSENVRAGEAIVTIAAGQGRYIVSYIRQEQHVEPAVGMEVDVRKRLAISPRMPSLVERVGPQVELVPEHLRRDPKIPEWGLPVRITIPDRFSGRPGELFEVTFKTRPKAASY